MSGYKELLRTVRFLRPETPSAVRKTRELLLRNREPDVRAIVQFIDDVTLPEGMTVADIQDSVKRAQQYIGYEYSQTVGVYKTVYSSTGRRMSGLATPMYPKKSDFFVRISLSVDEAILQAVKETEPGFYAGSAGEQLWAVAFEEAFHAARMMQKQFDHSAYYQLPLEASNAEYRKYMRQPEEQYVEDALNSGILESKFGQSSVYHCKRVLHPQEVCLPGSETRIIR